MDIYEAQMELREARNELMAQLNDVIPNGLEVMRGIEGLIDAFITLKKTQETQ